MARGVAQRIGELAALVAMVGLAFDAALDHEIFRVVRRDLDQALADRLSRRIEGHDLGLGDAVFAPDRLDINMLDRLMVKCSDRLTLLPAPATLERNYDFDVAAFDGVIDLLRMSAPMIVLDLPHVWNAWSQRLLTGADEVVVVAAPDLANLRNTKNLQDNLGPARSNDGKIKLVMNMVGVPKRPEIAVKDFVSSINIEPSLILPFDPKLFGAAANNGQMVAEVSGGAKIGALFENFGRLLCGRPELRKSKAGLLAGLKSSKLSFNFGKKS